MQLVYLDEAGISNKAHEPYLVVAAVIVNADKKWKELEQHFIDLANEFVPEYVPFYGHQLVFHAKDIWHGTGLFPRQQWPLKKRLAILERLAVVPSQFDLPIAIGHIDRKKFEEYCKNNQPDLQKAGLEDFWAHAEAFLNAVRRVETWMESNASAEVAMLIAEDSAKVKKIIDPLHSSYTDRSSLIRPRGKNEINILLGPLRPPYPDEYYSAKEPFRSQYIVDGVHFAKKEKSLLLQVADHCAFFAKRKLMKCIHVSPLYKKIAPQVIFRRAKDNGISVRVPIDQITPHL